MNLRKILAAVGLLAALSIAQPAMPATIKIATIAPKDSPWYEMLTNMANAWEQMSDGAIKTRIYANGHCR